MEGIGMNTEIDSLELKVKTDAQQAASSLNALAESLGKVKTATKGGTGLAAVEKQLSKIKSALDGLDSAKIAGAKTALDISLEKTTVALSRDDAGALITTSWTVGTCGVVYISTNVPATGSRARGSMTTRWLASPWNTC